MPEKEPRIYKIIIMILPVGVVIGTIVFMFAYFYMEREDERNHAVIASYGLRISDLDDMVKKFTDTIGERDHTTEKGKRGLRQAASTIEGRLGPQNVGYPVKKGEGMAMDGVLWKSLWVDLRGESAPEEVVFAAVSYAGTGEVADGNTASTMMILASSMAREKTGRTLRFVFLPMQLTPEEQNRWLIQKCLLEGETCAGIVGLKTMSAPPEAGGDHWEVVAPREQDQAWWRHVSESGARPDPAEDVSAWISTSVYSDQAWQDRRTERLQRTLKEARQIETWLRQAAR